MPEIKSRLEYDLTDFQPAPPGWYLAIHRNYPYEVPPEPMRRRLEFLWYPIIGWIPAKHELGVVAAPVCFELNNGLTVYDILEDALGSFVIVHRSDLSWRQRWRLRRFVGDLFKSARNVALARSKMARS